MKKKVVAAGCILALLWGGGIFINTFDMVIFASKQQGNNNPLCGTSSIAIMS